jgi:hypothetical protein
MWGTLLLDTAELVYSSNSATHYYYEGEGAVAKKNSFLGVLGAAREKNAQGVSDEYPAVLAFHSTSCLSAVASSSRIAVVVEKPTIFALVVRGPQNRIISLDSSIYHSQVLTIINAFVSLVLMASLSRIKWTFYRNTMRTPKRESILTLLGQPNFFLSKAVRKVRVKS